MFVCFSFFVRIWSKRQEKWKNMELFERSGDGMIFQSIVIDIINRNGCYWKSHINIPNHMHLNTEHNGHAFVDNVLTFFTPFDGIQCIRLFKCFHFIKRIDNKIKYEQKKKPSNKLPSIDRSIDLNWLLDCKCKTLWFNS